MGDGAAARRRRVLREPPPAVLFSAFGDSALNLELAVSTQAMAQSPRRFRSELNFAIDAAFRQHGIQIPFPQRDVHLKSARVEATSPSGEYRG